MADSGAPTVVFDARPRDAASARAAGAHRGRGGDDDDAARDPAAAAPCPPRAWVSYPRAAKHVAFAGDLLHGAPAEVRDDVCGKDLGS